MLDRVRSAQVDYGERKIRPEIRRRIEDGKGTRAEREGICCAFGPHS